MVSIKRALGVSLASRIWGAALSILVVPVYVRILGIESYGLIGLFASLQVMISFLDLGLGTTLIREFGRLAGEPDGRQEMQDAARSCEAVYLVVGFLIGVSLALLGPWLLDHWLTLDQLNRDEAGRALVWGAIALAIQWPATLYGSGLEGLQRQTSLGVLTASATTARVLLTLSAVSFVSPSIELFFAANALGACGHTLAGHLVFWRALGPCQRPARILHSFLARSRAFAGTVTGITVSSIILTQLDKVILSKVLTLPDFGIYALTSALAGGLYVLISPVFGILYPHLCSLTAKGNTVEIAKSYHIATQFLAFLLVPAVAVVAFFSGEILFVWTGNADICERAHWPLVFLFSGNAINGIMNAPYALQLAAGWTGLSLLLNVAAVVVLAPVTYFLALAYGPAGGAAAWLLLNIFLFLTAPQLMHERLLRGEMFKWYIHDIGRAVMAAGAAAALLHLALPVMTSRPMLGLAVVAAWLAALGATGLALPAIRIRLQGLYR
jgi:O-antigen/teichoic acid export membrane protein